MGELKDKIKDLVSAAKGPTLEIVSDVFLDGTVGALIPGVGNVILSYKQNRMERRIESVLKNLVSRQNELNDALAGVKEQLVLRDIKGKYFEMLMDYAIEEPQDEKIYLLVNGYINVARMPQPQEDVIRNYYDTLKQINILDIRVLKIFVDETTDKTLVDDILEDKFPLDIIEEKLMRLGLLSSYKEEKLKNALNEIIEHFYSILSEELYIVSKPRISLDSGYKISSYGEQFVKFFELECNEREDMQK